MESPADGGCEGLDAGPGARRRRVRKLPPYVLSRRAWSRGRGVRFILHAEGRVADYVIDRQQITAAESRALTLRLGHLRLFASRHSFSMSSVGNSFFRRSRACALYLLNFAAPILISLKYSSSL